MSVGRYCSTAVGSSRISGRVSPDATGLSVLQVLKDVGIDSLPEFGRGDFPVRPLIDPG